MDKSKPYRKSNRRKKSLPKQLKQINPNAAGIDIGSEEHYVAVPEGCDTESVRSFGCLTPELHQMAKWLKECGIDTVAMESTGVYWVPVAEVLERYDIDVKLVDAYHVKNVPGRKTDVKDCQWLQQLHMFGLLHGAFRPGKQIRVLRSYWRHRASLVKSCGRQIQLMQKALEQMNLQLHKVITDISGLTGMKIIRAIIAGQHDPVILAQMKHHLIRSSQETIVQALTGAYSEEHLFSLKQAVELYDIYNDKIADCDREIERYLSTFKAKDGLNNIGPQHTKNKRSCKNAPHFNLRSELYRITGVDLTQIDAIDVMTAHTVICECGYDMSLFPTEKHFSSWLGLCPNNRITGGKVFSSKTRKVQNRVALLLRVSALSLHRSKTALGAYYRRMHARLGAPKAITAAAHKLAILIYRMLKYGEDYVDKGQLYYEEQYRTRALKNLKIRARQMGYELLTVETGEVVS